MQCLIVLALAALAQASPLHYHVHLDSSDIVPYLNTVSAADIPQVSVLKSDAFGSYIEPLSRSQVASAAVPAFTTAFAPAAVPAYHSLAPAVPGYAHVAFGHAVIPAYAPAAVQAFTPAAAPAFAPAAAPAFAPAAAPAFAPAAAIPAFAPAAAVSSFAPAPAPVLTPAYISVAPADSSADLRLVTPAVAPTVLLSGDVNKVNHLVGLAKQLSHS